MSTRRADELRRERRAASIHDGWGAAADAVALRRVAEWARIGDHGLTGVTAWAVIDGDGGVRVNGARDAEPAEWAWVFTHLLLHLGLGHLDPDVLAEQRAVTPGGAVDPTWSAACCVAVERFADVVRVGRSPFPDRELPGGDEASLTRWWRDHGLPPGITTIGPGGAQPCLRVVEPKPVDPRWTCGPTRSRSWVELFAAGLTEATTEAMRSAADSSGQTAHRRTREVWDRALSWFVSSYPLLGAVAAGLVLVADAELARAWDIRIAAVSPERGEVYVNPHAELTAEEWRFVLAHEMLHAALRHDSRAHGRDPYLWNVACDYVINGWLVAMGVGDIPDGSLYDGQLTGLSAESVYDTLTTDLRRARKLLTFGGRAVGDVLGDWLSEPDAAARRGSRRVDARPPPGGRAAAVDLDDFYRRALTHGFTYHVESGRGLLPAGLVEEIRALEHPPLPWDVRLARWFDEHVRAAEPVRSYARPSRRQSATPDIARPGRVRPEQRDRLPTFGVVLDTSGSMDPRLLGKALGAIASYATAHDVPAARVVFCDAVAYDAGYVAVEEIAGRVRVRGRGGTVLQPGVDALERAADFPADGPILVITDAECDVVRVRRAHAFLVPKGARLPFTPRGPVFRVV